jgi:hypothetical protein
MVTCTDIVLLQQSTFDPRVQRSIAAPDSVRRGNKGPWKLVLLEDPASGSIEDSCLGRASLLAKCSSISNFAVPAQLLMIWAFLIHVKTQRPAFRPGAIRANPP